MYGHFPIFEIDDSVGVMKKGHDIGGNKKFLLSDSHDQGAFFAHGYDPIRVLTVQDDQGIGSSDLFHGHLNGFNQSAAFYIFVDQMGDDFRIRFR